MNWRYCKKCVRMTRHIDGLCVDCKTSYSEDPISPFDDMNLDELKILVSQSMFLASLNDARLTILMDWLRSYSSVNLSDGHLEYALASAKEDAVHRVGEYLQEILNMESEIVFKEAIAIKLK